jgi:ATP-dependent Zn protease
MRKAAYIGGAILILVVLVVVFFRPSTSQDETRPISVFLSDMRAGGVSYVEVNGGELEVTLLSGVSYRTHKERESSLFNILADNDIEPGITTIVVNDAAAIDDWLGLLLNFIPILLFLGILLALIRAINRLGQRR